jgi:hypothetical protein
MEVSGKFHDMAFHPRYPLDRRLDRLDSLSTPVDKLKSLPLQEIETQIPACSQFLPTELCRCRGTDLNPLTFHISVSSK